MIIDKRQTYHHRISIWKAVIYKNESSMLVNY